MKNSLLQRATQFYQNRRRKQLWYRVVSGMACVVVFCTVYALILPAITLEKKPACGLEEHTHTEDCYTTQAVWPTTEYLCDEESLSGHIHDETCYDEDDNLICGYADFVVHTHDDRCYDRNGDLVCPLPEIEEHQHNASCYSKSKILTCGEEETGHIHGSTCYTRVRGDLCCGQEESEGHTHGPACYETEQTLACDQAEGEDHTHDESCYAARDVLTCQLEESEGHAHSDDCYQWTEELCCGREEDLDGHIHSASCYTTVTELVCEKEEVILHTHDESCFDTEDCPLCAEEDPQEHTHPLICGKLQVLAHQHDENCAVEPEGESEEVQVLACGKQEHTHTDACYEAEVPANGGIGEQTYICGLEEHAHDETCYDESGELTCMLEEHVHGEACLTLAEVPLRELTYEGTDYTVSVSFGEDAALPEGVTLSAEEIAPDSEEYQTYYQQTLDTLTAQQTEGAEQLLFARFFDVQFLLDGEVLEPAASVSVTITYNEPVVTGGDVNCQSIHFTEEGPELLEAEAEEDPESGATSFTHTQESFSVVGNVTSRSVANETDVGPDSLPVDYYVCIDGKWTCVGTTKTGWYGDYTATSWENTNRDCITVAQAESILGSYGFNADAPNAALQIAYQRKETNKDANLHCDTRSYIDEEKSAIALIPLARNVDPSSGYNLYFLPGNTNNNYSSKLENVNLSGSQFYTVTVSDGSGGTIVKSEPILTGGSFNYDAFASRIEKWLVAYGDGTSTTIEGSNISLSSITSTVHISPYQAGASSHSVTFKVMIDGQWQEVGALPYYYTGTVNGSQRAYITSGMAAQFFGDFGYTATTDPGYHFGYSYNDIYQIRYADGTTHQVTNFAIDIPGGNYDKVGSDYPKVTVYSSNETPAQLFRIRTAEQNGTEEGYKFISPLLRSDMLINVQNLGETNGQKLILCDYPQLHSSWKIVPAENGLVSFQLKEGDSFFIDVNKNEPSNGLQLQIYQNAGAKYWKLVQQYRVSNNTVSQRNDDGTYNIGLTAESNGDIVCYYMPAETASTYTNVAESAIKTANSFWSVSVRDDTNTVYSDGELSTMVQYVAPGGEATVTVANADGILWGCRGVNGAPVEVESSQANGYTTFTIKNITQPIEVTATRANPSFTVQYYANIQRLATSGGSASLTVIDTSGKNLPKNGTTPATKSMQLEDTGWSTNQNAGNATKLYRVKTNTELTKLYSDGQFQYSASPDLAYFDKLKDNGNYSLKEIWVLKNGKDAASLNRADWNIYTYTSDTTFTNEASQAVGNTILINDGDVVRLVSDTNTGKYYNGTTFYDYNISSGKNGKGRWATGITGINSSENYGTSKNGRNWDNATRDGRDLISVGNRNTGTGLGTYAWGCRGTDYYPNMNNSANIGGCIFELVTGLNSDGTIHYDDWLIAPKLFNEGDATGKQTYAGSSLTFEQVGDTFTLSSAALKGGGKVEGLQYFFNPSPDSGTTHTHIFTNNFWPMDQAPNRTDPLFGKDTSVRYDGFEYWKTNSNCKTQENYYLPLSDDGKDHNSFFGMARLLLMLPSISISMLLPTMQLLAPPSPWVSRTCWR